MQNMALVYDFISDIRVRKCTSTEILNTFLAVQTCKASSHISIAIHRENRVTSAVFSYLQMWIILTLKLIHKWKLKRVVLSRCCSILECLYPHNLFFTFCPSCGFSHRPICSRSHGNQFNLWGLKWSNDCHKGAHFLPNLSKILWQSCLNPQFRQSSYQFSYSAIKSD